LGRLLFVGSAFALVLGFGIFAYFAWSMTASTPPAYEESHPIPSDLNREMARLDIALYESLYSENLSVNDILFRVVEERREGNVEWEFTEVDLRVPESIRIMDLEAAILKELSHLAPAVHAKPARAPTGETIVDLFVFGHPTHRVRITKVEKQKRPESERKPLIAIIIDDLGYDLELARSFMGMGVPLTLSVLSMATHSTTIAEMARESGFELILHLPMEPQNHPHVNPGPGAILAGMSDEEIRSAMEKHLKRIPWVKGVNNHMGSRLTEMEDKMAVVFGELRKRGLFYVDSRTTRRSVALELGNRFGVPVATRGVFLDHTLSRKTMAIQIERLLGLARSAGSAIAIGHPHRETLKCLRDALPRIKNSARLVTVSEILLPRPPGGAGRVGMSGVDPAVKAPVSDPAGQGKDWPKSSGK
jgi:uncharacterized protein